MEAHFPEENIKNLYAGVTQNLNGRENSWENFQFTWLEMY